MASSTESKLKSKYQSSSKKIQELYQQFSNMRKQICTPSKPSRNQRYFLNSYDKGEKDSGNYSIQVPIPKYQRSRQLTKKEVQVVLNIQNQTLIKNALMKNYTSCLIQLDKRVDQKISIYQTRLENLKNLFIQLSSFYQIKVEKSKTSKKLSCKCSQVNVLLKQVQTKYEKKIAEMMNNYETKISLLVKEHQDTSDSSNSKQITKQLQDQYLKLQQKYYLKQQQITSLKIEQSRLRRTIDHQKVLVTQKQSLISELTNEINDKQSKLSELVQFKVQRITSQEKTCALCLKAKQKIQSLQKQIQLKEKDIKQLQKRIVKINTQVQFDQKSRKAHKNHLKQWNQSFISQKQLAVSDYEQQTQMVADIEGFDSKFIQSEPLRNTQFFNSNNRKNSTRFEKKIKELEAELELVLEQNRLLKNKKDKFQQQCKQNQSDQQRFQMQSQILREEIKKLNLSLKSLDQCAVLYLKDKKNIEQSVDKLQDSIKFKQQYFKKYPKRKKSTRS